MCDGPGDQLLYVLSSWGAARWSQFREAFDFIVKEARNQRDHVDWAPSGFHPQVALRAISALGHCEIDTRDGRLQVLVAPPFLARLPRAGFPVAVLCGARAPQTVAEVTEAASKLSAKVDVRRVLGPSLWPAAVLVQAEKTEILGAIAERLGIGFGECPSSWSLLSSSITIHKILENLEWKSVPPLDWKREAFDPGRPAFRKGDSPDQGLCLVRYRNPVSRDYLFRLEKSGQTARIHPDWGRYAILCSAGVQPAAYDSASGRAYFPSAAPLPRLLARALVLCSGKPPVAEENESRILGIPSEARLLGYQTVPADVYALVCSKLLAPALLPQP